jgi:hypothetical protein
MPRTRALISLVLIPLAALLSACAYDESSSPNSPRQSSSLGEFKHVQAEWNNQFTCPQPDQWHEWAIPNEKFAGIVARATSRDGHYVVQFSNGYYRPVRITWNATSSTADVQKNQTITLESGVSTASPIVTAVSSAGSPTPDLFVNIIDVEPAN